MQQHQLLTLKASAGSGKTFALTLRYLSLLFYGAKASEILALTFTKKAAGEMHERITKALEEIAKEKEKSIYFIKLQEQYHLNKESLLSQTQKIYEDFLSSAPKITTIDAFFNSIVKKFCWYVGLSNHYEIKAQDTEKIDETFLNLLSQTTYEALLRFYTMQKRNSFDFLNMMSNYDFDLKKQEVSFAIIKDILQLAQSIKEDILKHPQASDRAKNAIKTTSIQELLENPKWLIDGDEYLYFKKLKLNHQANFDSLKEKIKIYFDMQERYILNIIADFVPLYKKARFLVNQKKFSLDFSDITLKAYEILTQQIHKDFFYFRLDDKISHILIDEFQDTNQIQYQILLPLIEEIKSGEGRIEQRSLFFVGDSKQSIYGFRGSDSTIFEIVSQYTQDENLTHNYRSQSRIIDFNNQTFQSIFQNYIPQLCPKEDKEGYIRIYEPLENISEMQEMVLHSIELLLQKNINPNDIAILCYKNDDLEDLKSFLSSRLKHITFITETNLKLTKRKQPQILIQCLLYTKSNNPLYKKNITKLLGLDYESELEIPAFETNLTLCAYIYKLMQHFKICDIFAQQFLEASFLYDDLETFLEEIEKIQLDPIKENINGITLMTIHKSKGLEFDHIIICDRFGKKAPNIQPFIFDTNKIWYRQSKREFFDSAFDRILQKEKNRLAQEEKNVLYVAFTRAKKSLFVIQKNKDSAFEILNLQPSEIGNLQPSTSNTSYNTSPILPFEQKDYGKQEGFLIQKEIANHQDILFGEAMHFALEYTFGFCFTQKALREKLLNLYGFSLEIASIETILSRIENLKQEETFLQILQSKKSYCEIVFLQELHLYRIDMLLKGDKEIIILDYKSGTQKIEHQTQVQQYLNFAKSFFYDKTIKGYLVYLWDKVYIQEVNLI